MKRSNPNRHSLQFRRLNTRHPVRTLRFESLEDKRLLAFDFGDAPSPYPVTLAEDGARHNTAEWQNAGSAIDGQPRDYSGGAVSLSGDGKRLIVGSDGNGLARVYEHDGVQWTQLGSDIVGGGVFGRATSISSTGDIVAVGAPYLGNGGLTRVYRFNGSDWSQLGSDINGERSLDNAGEAISLSADGNTIAVGAAYNDGNGNSAGHTRVYRFDGSQWTQLGGDLDGELAGDYSGSAVSLSAAGNTVAIGAPGHDSSGNNAGQVRIYHLNGTQWTQRGGDLEGESAGDSSGEAISLSADGNTVAIGAAWIDENGTAAGQTRVYRFAGGLWTQLGGDLNGESSDRSGAAVSLNADGNTLAIGAPAFETPGKARIFSLRGTSWVQQGANLDGETFRESFGESVSLSADGLRLAVGSPFKGLTPSDDNNITGSASVFYASDQSLRLGELRDSEADGAASNVADGDGADEDGISISPLVAGTTAPIDVNVRGRAGKLDAWVDFNADGDWQDPGEQIFTSESVSVGVNSLSFEVPNDAVGGGPASATQPATFARFRLSTIGGLSVTGAASDGEVEDYQVIINAAPTLNAIPDPPTLLIDAGEQMINLRGITAGGAESQPLQVEVTSSNEAVTGTPTVDYVSPRTTTTLRFSPTATALGDATITVTVMDGGLDQNLETTSDNAVTQREFQVKVIQREDPWTNPTSVFDVNGSNTTTLLDGLQIVNLVNRFPEYAMGLPDLSQKAGEDINGDGISDPYLGNFYPDVNGNGKASLGDALAVINKINQILSQQEQQAEGEDVGSKDAYFMATPEQLDSTFPASSASGTSLQEEATESFSNSGVAARVDSVGSSSDATKSATSDTELFALLGQTAETRKHRTHVGELSEQEKHIWDLQLASLAEEERFELEMR